MRTRADHLAWCKRRALDILESGDEPGAVASMVSDLGKWSEPLYAPDVLELLVADGMLTRHGPEQVRAWIEGFR